jgi:hypothetical protein
MVGDPIQIQISFSNPSMVLIKSIVINGQVITLSGSVTTFTVVTFVPDFLGGEYYASVSHINYLSFGITSPMEISSSLDDSIYFFAELDVLSISTISEINVLTMGENQIILEINNPENYEINTLQFVVDHILTTFESDQIIQIDEAHVAIKINPNLGWHNFTLQNIEFGNTENGFVSQSESFAIDILVIASNEVRSISTISELQTMENGYIYELTNDIDAAGFGWTPYSFSGILYGNGFSIQNLAIVWTGTISQNTGVGLFSQFNGIIDQVSIENSNIYVSLAGTTGYAYALSVGAFAGNLSANSVIRNSNMNYVSVTVVSLAIGYDNNFAVYVGGFAGTGQYINSCIAENLHINVSASKVANVGGLVGFGYLVSDSSIIDSSIIVSVSGTGTSNVGGILAYGYEAESVTVTNTSISVSYEGSNIGTLFVGGISGNVTLVTDSIISEILLNIESTSTVNIGGVVGNIVNGNVENTDVSGSIIAIVNSLNNTFSLVGGIAGYSSSSIISTSSTKLSIDATITSNEIAAIGGMVGRFQDNSQILNSVSNNVIDVTTNILANSTYVGGFVGYSYESSIMSSISIGSISSSAVGHIAVGGFAGGVMWSDYTNSVAFVDYTDHLISLVGMLSDTDTINNCYNYESFSSEQNEIVLLVNLNSSLFYTEILKWEDNIWNLSILDFENELYPILSRTTN